MASDYALARGTLAGAAAGCAVSRGTRAIIEQRSAGHVTHASPELREQLTERAHEFGTRAFAKSIGVSREALLGMIAGLPVRRGSIALAAEALAQLTKVTP